MWSKLNNNSRFCMPSSFSAFFKKIRSKQNLLQFYLKVARLKIYAFGINDLLYIDDQEPIDILLGTFDKRKFIKIW